jgi:hypothetical protein
MIPPALKTTWHTRDLKTRFLAAIAIAVFALVALRLYYGLAEALATHAKPFNDFSALWSFGRFAAAGHGSEIYDADALHRFQLELTGVDRVYPFPYPPFFLLLLWPVGMLASYATAYLLWVAVTFGLYALASCGRARCGLTLGFLAIAPTSVITVFTGQTGFLSSALLIGGFRCAGTRPVLSGIMFGLLAFKPQLGLLVPVALLAAGLWRPVISAAVTVVGLVAASALALGPDIWLRWLAALPGHWALAVSASHVHPLMPTVAANLLLLHAPAALARDVQVGATLLVILLTGWCCRRGVAGLNLATVEVGAFLATPYAFVYDMPMVTNAMLAYLGDKHRRGAPLGLSELVIVTATLMLPVLVALWTSYVVFGVVILMLSFAMLCRGTLRAPVPELAGSQADTYTTSITT